MGSRRARGVTQDLRMRAFALGKSRQAMAGDSTQGERLAEIVCHLALRTVAGQAMMVAVKPRRVVILAFPGVQPLDVSAQ
jgi:hypothetical protein